MHMQDITVQHDFKLSHLAMPTKRTANAVEELCARFSTNRHAT